MNEALKYFNGEKIQCSIGVAIALLSIGAGTYFLLQIKKPFYNGMAYPFIIIAVLLSIICIAVIIRSPKDIVRVNTMIQTDKAKITTEEIPRMEKVLKSFKVIEWVEICLAVIGVVLFFLLPAGSLWRGVYAGLFIQSALLFAFDFIAESRGKTYIDFLRTLI